MFKSTNKPYSYRDDPSVPAFEDAGPVVFMDGECVICSRSARVIARLDRANEFRICATQSALGRAVMTHYGLDPDDPDSWLYLVDGKPYTSMDAVIRVGTRLGGWGRAAQILRILPVSIQDWLYSRLARSRYRLFGRSEVCLIDDKTLHSRLLK